MNSAVDLHHEGTAVGAAELRVQVAPMTLTVEPHLKSRPREAVTSAEPEKFHLTQCVGSPFEIAREEQQQPPVPGARRGQKQLTERGGGVAQLLHPSDKDPRGGQFGGGERGRIHYGSCTERDRQVVEQPDTIARERAVLMHLHFHAGYGKDSRPFGNKDVDRSAGEARDSAELENG